MENKKQVYMDYNATTPVEEEVLEAMLPFLKGVYGNASSMHLFGQAAKKALEASRESIAQNLGAKHPDEIIFTGCGTESNNTAIKGAARANKKRGNHIITSNIEHPAVLNPCQYLAKEGWDITYAKADTEGIVKLEEIKKAISPKTIIVSVMHANNEIGTIQPVEEIGGFCREKNVLFHTDAVQAAGKLPIDVEKMNIDMLSISAHKFYGPKGVGALYVRRGVRITPLMHGGHHEKKRRAGTENVAGIVGMAKALELALIERETEKERIGRLRDKLENGILSKVEYSRVNGNKEKRLANTTNIMFEFIEGEGIILLLDSTGVALSTGSACASGDLEPSHVLKAIGVPKDKAHGSVRFSLGKKSTEEDVDYALSVLPGVIGRLRDMSPLWEDKLKMKKTQKI